MSSADSGATQCTLAAARAPAVTVLIPAHNAGTFLREAVDSILAQSFTDFECLVIDDGSTDGAVDALRAIPDPRLRIECNPRNLGLIATLNRGLELARAPLLARMDADDVALPQRLDRQVEAFAAEPRLALLGTWATLIDPLGRSAGLTRTPTEHHAIVRAILRNNAFIHPSVMARNAVLRALGGYPADALHAEDYALWLRVTARHQVGNLPEPLMRYRIHPGQVSQRQLAAQRAMAMHLQGQARAEFHRLGVLPRHLQPPPITKWDRLCGAPGSLGYDYLSLAKRNRMLASPALARAAAAAGLATAPLCTDLWREWLPPQANPRRWLRRLRGGAAPRA
jgi:hypothetical protein